MDPPFPVLKLFRYTVRNTELYFSDISTNLSVLIHETMEGLQGPKDNLVF